MEGWESAGSEVGTRPFLATGSEDLLLGSFQISPHPSPSACLLYQLLFLRPQYTFTPLASELLLLKGCPLLESRGQDTLILGTHNRLEGTGGEPVLWGSELTGEGKDPEDRHPSTH